MPVKKIKKNKSELWTLFTVLMSVLVFRLLLTFKGHFHLQDELRYRFTFAFIRELINIHPIIALEQLFQFPLYARPGLVLFNLPTAILQVVWLVFTGIKTETPLSLTIPSVVQALVSVGSSLLVFKISKRYLGHFFSLAVVVVYSLLINTNLYLRHILPYDMVLFVYLWLLWGILSRYKNLRGLRRSFVVGAVTAFLHLVYPAFYLFSLIIGFLTTFLPRKGRLLRGTVFSFSFGLILIIVELVSKTLGYSFWTDTKFLVSRVVVGNPYETPIFIFKYLLRVEGVVGILLLGIFSLFVIHFLTSSKKYSREFRLMSWAVMGSYFLHGLSGPLSGKVFYGRSIHMYFWFVVLASFMFVKTAITSMKIRSGLAAGLLAFSLFSFTQWYPEFLSLNYPVDVMHKLVGSDYGARVSVVNENHAYDNIENQPLENPEYVGINFGKYFFPEIEVYAHDTLGGELIFQAPHPLNFVAYQFEALTPQERQLIQERNYQMKLYRLP